MRDDRRSRTPRYPPAADALAEADLVLDSIGELTDEALEP